MFLFKLRTFNEEWQIVLITATSNKIMFFILIDSFSLLNLPFNFLKLKKQTNKQKHYVMHHMMFLI